MRTYRMYRSKIERYNLWARQPSWEKEQLAADARNYMACDYENPVWPYDTDVAHHELLLAVSSCQEDSEGALIISEPLTLDLHDSELSTLDRYAQARGELPATCRCYHGYAGYTVRHPCVEDAEVLLLNSNGEHHRHVLSDEVSTAILSQVPSAYRHHRLSDSGILIWPTLAV